jgi:hypothetical protein
MRTSYSRRELYAFGEPLGDSTTYLKADGGLILGDGGGGGGSQPANTTSTSTQTTELPEWARGYAKEALAKGQALTDVNQNPYQTYTNPRIAGFSPMQQQSFQNAAGMSVAPQIGQGTAAATGAGLGGFDVAGQANVGGFQNQVGGYMNPYMNQILAPQLAEANRNYDIGATKQQSAATQAGAFGGTREAIMAAENERNRNMGLNQIYGQGLNTAYTNAQNQYNQNLQNQLAGYGMANQAAGQLGQLGQNQYQQSMGINTLQNQYGGQQQALQQQGLSQAYQDFQNQQNYPYKQLGFMSDLIRGLPLGQQSTKAVYEPGPSTAQNVASLGLGAYGIGQMFKAEGGSVKSMAGGGLGGSVPGGSVLSREYKEGVVDNIPTNQGLQAAVAGAQARGDGETELAARNEMSEDAAIRRGISGQVPDQFADNMVRAANGGIVAFAVGGTPSKSELIKQSLEDREQQSPEDYLANVTKRSEGLSTLYGPDLTTPFAKELAETREQYKGGNLSDFDKGLIALQMSGAAVDPAARGKTASAIGLIAKVGGQAGAQLAAQNKQANRELLKAQSEMATSQQNRNEGRVRLAADQEDKAETRKAAAFEQRRDAISKAAEILSAEERNKATVGAQMASINKPGESERKIADYEKRLGRKLTADEFLDVMGQVGAATYGVRHTGQKGDFERKTKVDELIQKDRRFETIALDLMRAGGKKDAKSTALRDDANSRLEGLRNEYETRYKLNDPAAGAGAGAPTGGAKIPNPQAIEALRGNPALRDQFDKFYGPGSSSKYLGG